MPDVFKEDYPAYLPTFLNIATNGWATFPNLVNLADLSSCNLVIFDWINNTSDEVAEVEALLRRLQQNGQRAIIINSPTFASLGNEQVEIPANAETLAVIETLASAYNVPLVRGDDIFAALVPGTNNLDELMDDTVHPSGIGHQAYIDDMKVNNYLPLGRVPTLPAERLYADSEDFENDPVVIVGTGRDAITGTWATDGTSVSSSEVGATITFSGTFRKFGVYNAPANYPTCTVTIDGGAPLGGLTMYPNGYDIGTRGVHTVVLTVTSAMQIDKFWAI